MLNAARKALKNVDPTKIEDVGRRALKNLETLDAKKVGKIGYKAAKNLDPRKIEEVAEEAGKELLSVMERVAERVERIASGAIQGAKEGTRPAPENKVEAKSAPPPVETPPAAKPEQAAKPENDPAQKRVRIGD
jgi:hypothetical protein